MKILLLCLLVISAWVGVPASAAGTHTRHSYSHSRPYRSRAYHGYGHGGGHYSGGRGSSHKGGHYTNSHTGNHYRRR
jgi:hypothetical protein